jgi:hypothetical protein
MFPGGSMIAARNIKDIPTTAVNRAMGMRDFHLDLGRMQKEIIIFQPPTYLVEIQHRGLGARASTSRDKE